LKSELTLTCKERDQALADGKRAQEKLEKNEAERREEKKSVEDMLGNMQHQRSTASERMVAEAAAQASLETERRLNEQHSGEMMLLKNEIHEKAKTIEGLRHSLAETNRKMEQGMEKIVALNSVLETVKRKLEQAESLVDGKDNEIGSLQAKIRENDKHFKKEIDTLNTQNSLQLSSAVAEASASSRREEEEKTRLTLKEIQHRLDTNHAEVKIARAFLVLCLLFIVPLSC
jgi:chromosome segregation ATPase